MNIYRDYYILVFLLLYGVVGFGQCPEVDAGDDQLECSLPATFDLSGELDGDIVSFIWCPETDLSDPESLTPQVTLDEPRTYYLKASSVDFDINLVENGDFSDGNTAFDTDYDFSATPSLANELVEGEYTIGTDPSPMHLNWDDCGDHTSGNGEMMIVNGDETANQQVWCQTVNIMPDTEYFFAAFVASVDPNGPAEIQFQIDGADIGNGNVAIQTTCEWVEFSTFWDSENNTSIEICIQDVNTDEPGNDFAIDDISFSPLCEEIDSITLTPVDFEPEISDDIFICAGEEFTIEAFGGIYYEWDGPSNFDSEDNPITIQSATVDMTGEYYVEIEDENGCEDELFLLVDVSRTDSTFVYEATCDQSLAGVFVDDLTNQFSCDSIVTRTVEYFDSSLDTVYLTSCDQSLVGLDTLNLINQYGCDSTIYTQTSLIAADSTFVTDFTCDPSAAMEVIEPFISTVGCDSFVVTQLIFVPVDFTFLTDQTCDSNLAGVSIDTLQNSNGCDSIVQTDLLFIPPDSTFLENYSCDINAVGTFTDVFQNQNGCDSIVEVQVLLVDMDSTFLIDQSCDANLVGINTEVFQNQFGCDSIVQTETILVSVDSTFLMDITCDINLEGLNTEVFTRPSGCDSIVITELMYVEADSTFLTDMTCDINLVGLDTEVFTGSSGCDSIVFTEFMYVAADSIFLTDQTCDINLAGITSEVFTRPDACDSIVITESIYLEPDSTFLVDRTCDVNMVGVETEVFQNQFGCDSIVETDFIFVLSDSTFLTELTCDTTLLGVNTDMFQNQSGCDSLVITEFLLLTPDYTYLTDYTCSPIDTGTNTEVFTNAIGCDSIVITEVLLSQSDSTFLTLMSCDLSEIGEFVEVLMNDLGCDSTVTTIVSLIPQDTTYLTSTTCLVEEVGAYAVVMSNQMGCDSVIITQVEYESDLALAFEVSQLDCFTSNEGSILVNPSGGNAPYTYALNNSDFQEDPGFYNLTNGTYELIAIDADGCTSSDIIIINEVQTVDVSLGEDFSVALGDTATLESVIDIPYDSLIMITWTPEGNLLENNGLVQDVYPLLTTTYEIEVVNTDGCSDKDELTVSVAVEKDIYVPNILSPAERGDPFMIYAKEGVISNISTFQGYDRWGNNVFFYDNILPNESAFSWDGTYNGYQVNPGVFVWFAEIEFVDGTQAVISGSLTLLR